MGSHLEVRNADSWVGACDALVAQLKELGFCAGQIYSIDVHNNGPDDDAIISAHYHGQPLGAVDNTCHVEYEIKNDSSSWTDHYTWCDERVAAARADGKKIIGVSHSISMDNNGVSVVWYEQVNPYKFL
jgi:hypothetical protein